ncbi:MAG: GIY-YIG nuclease family protein [Myxococcota bacterium]
MVHDMAAAAPTDDAGTNSPDSSSWFVYLLTCADGSLYCGATNDPLRRLAQHHAGRAARYTRARGVVAMVFLEEVESKGAALSLEARIKRLPAAQKRLLAGL